METKTSKAITLFKNGSIREALNIFKSFRIGFTKEQKRTIQIASECLNGNAAFYKQIGTDTNGEITNAMSIIKSKYNTV